MKPLATKEADRYTADVEKALYDLFLHDGWKIVMEEMREAHQVLLETAYTVRDERELYQRKGELLQLSKFISYEQLFRLQAEENEQDI